MLIWLLQVLTMLLSACYHWYLLFSPMLHLSPYVDHHSQASTQRDIFFEGKENGSQIVTLNRPEQLNALNQGTAHPLSLSPITTSDRNDQLFGPVVE